jgi:DNA polymerase/3'-5' exonuclease PolX
MYYATTQGGRGGPGQREVKVERGMVGHRQCLEMQIGKYKDNPPRRIDIRFIPSDSWFSALVYFTVSAELNKKMRNIAKVKKLAKSDFYEIKIGSKQVIDYAFQDLVDENWELNFSN